MNVVKNQVVIQARTGSTRLPGKVLLKLCNRTVLEHVVRRCGRASLVDRVIVATTELPEDQVILNWCKENNIFFVTGSSEDVLSRYVKAVEAYPANRIVRVTADCPLVDPGVIDTAISMHKSLNADYVTNVLKPTFPAGFDVEVVSVKTLKKVNEIASLKSHREHVTMYIRENLSEFVTGNFELGGEFEHFRLTLDRPEDFEVIENVMEAIPENVIWPSIYEILEILEKKPEICRKNMEVDRFEGMRKSAKEENRQLKWE